MASDLLAPPSRGSLSELSSRFDGLAARLRRVALLRGLGRVALVTAALCAAALIVDWLWPLPGSLRMGCLGLIVTVTGFTVWSQVFRPVFRKFTIAELAALVETQYPELGERLTSAVELTDPSIPEEHKGSALMREYLEAETMSSTRHLDFRKAVSSERAQKSAWLGGFAAAILLLPFLVMPSGYGPLWARLLMPWGAHELPAVLYFHVPDGTRIVARGEDLKLVALPPEDVAIEDLPDAVELVWTNGQGETYIRPTEYVAEEHGFVATLPHVFEDFDYIVSAKRKRSERHTITVVDRPEITAFTLVITPPAYTGLAETEVDGAIGDVTVFERSRIKAVLEFNKPLANAEWLWRESGQHADAKDQEVSKPTALPFQLSEDRKSATLEFLADEGSFVVKASDEHGLSNLEETPRRLIVTPDQPPELSLSGESGTTRARRDDVIALDVSVKDDVAVAAVELHLETSKGQTEVKTVLPEALGGQEVNSRFDLELAAFGLSDGDSVKYRVRAADNRPVPGPNEVWSEERRIVIDPNAPLPGSKDVVNRQTELRDILEAIRRDLKKNLADTEQLRKAALDQKAKGQPFDKQEELAALENGQRDIADRLEELADRFGQNRLLANLTPETKRIAREPVNDAVKETQRAQEQDQVEKQTETLERTEDALAKADEDLKNLAERFEELAGLERDLMVLGRLAKQAEQVAEQALGLAKQRENPPADETPEQQAAREAQVAQEEGLLEEQRQQLADALDELLTRRPEVLEAAEKSALEQIAELSKQAAHLADRQDALTESLKSDADQAVKASAPLAGKQQELLKKLEVFQPKQPKEPDSVTPVDPEALRKVLEELKAGNLDAASKQQDALADRLESLAAELKKNQALPDDPKQAAAELAKRQGELADQVAKAAKNPPAENANPEDKQAFENKLRDLAEKQTGIQAGIAQLETPAANRKQQQDALDQAAKAVENLTKQKSEDASENAKQAADALDKLAENIGTPEERAAQAKEAVETLRKQQEELKKEALDALKEKSNLDELAKRQNDLAERLAQVDAPKAEEPLMEALRQSVQAKNDLEKERLEDVEASQARAEQGLADLAKNLSGKPSAREEVEELKKRQDAIAKETANAHDPTQLTKQAETQKEVAKQLENLEAPAAEAARNAAENAAKNAAESLEKPTTAGQTQKDVEQAAKALDQLQKALSPKSPENVAGTAEELAKRHAQAAKEAAQKNQAPPTPAEREQQADELAQRTEEAKNLPAGDATEQEKHEALEALQKAAEAQEELEELIKKQEQATANDPKAQPQPKDKEDLQRLMQDNAEAQKKAAEALERLEQELAKKENQEKLHDELNEIQEEAEQLAEENQPRPNDKPENLPEPEDLEQLAEEARAIQEEINQLKQEIAGVDKEKRAQQAQSAKAQPNPAQNPKGANDQAQNNQEASASRPKDSEVNPSDAKDSDPNNSKANASRANPSPAPMPAENSEKNSPTPENANDAKPMPTPAENQNAKQNAERQQPNPSRQNGSRENQQRAEQSGQSLTDLQAELARKSAELALKVAQDQGAQSPATQKATDAARKADAAREQAQDGALQRAAKSAQEAADASNAAAQELEKNSANGQEPNVLAKEAAAQSQAQSELAKEFSEAAANPAQRRAAQAAGQESLAESSKKLADELTESAKKLSSVPLDSEESGEKARAAGESAKNAAQEMQAAKSSAANGNAAEAARAGEKASESLREAAGKTPAPPADTPKNTLVPSDLAGQITDARRRLEEAKKQLQAAQSKPMPPQNAQADNNQPMPPGDSNASKPDNSAEPMMGQNNPGESANAQNQPGQQSPMAQGQQGEQGKQGQQAQKGQQRQQGQKGQQGQQGQQSSALAQSAQSLQEAAKSLGQAAQQLQGGVPGKGPPSNSTAQASSPSQSQGQPSGKGSEGPGAQGEFPLKALEAELQRQNREDWGQLPGHLRTEILQGNKQKTEGDYARLIKLYSEELLKKQQAPQETSQP